ncbi:MAG: hypothetical protein D6696_02080 [Acidobacteria bacterium]|nr:MAG: hypothetical protein D6696_02080 [Acidobacteriota bacterium]
MAAERAPLVAILLLPLAVAAGAPSSAAEPLVATGLKIEASAFAINLGSGKTAVETAIADHLAQHAGRNFRFLRWPASAERTSHPVADARLGLRLVEEERPFGKAIFLLYEAGIGDRVLAVPGLPRHEVYDVFDDQPTHNPLQLIIDLKEVIDGDFERDDSFLQALEESFLRFIPLEAEVLAHPPLQSVIVTVPWQDLRAATGSELRVELKARAPAATSAAGATSRSAATPLADAPSQDGTLLLRPTGAIDDARWPGMTQCAVDQLDFPGLASPWDDRLATVLERPNLLAAQVFMHCYVLDPRSDMPGGVDVVF